MENIHTLEFHDGELTVISIAMACFCREMLSLSGTIGGETEMNLGNWAGTILEKIAATQGVSVNIPKFA